MLATLALLGLACGPRVTFSEHVAPILQAKCQSCHRPGQMAPMSLLTYQESFPFASAIRASVSAGKMPPFYADGPPGYYKDDIRLSEEEKRILVAWAEAGAPEGDPSALPEPVEWDDSDWPFGEPDMILRLPPHTTRANYRDQNITFFADRPFPHEIWARAIHLRTKSRKAVHHSTVFLVDPSTPVPARRKTQAHTKAELGALFTWFPGLVIDPLPEGQAIRLQEGWRLAARTHFGPSGERRSERMDVGIYFANGYVDKEQKKLGIQFIQELVIPPGASDFTLTGERRFPEDAEITHFRVHMHLRGKSSKVVLHYPDGTRQTVFDLPRYHFNWQRYYYLAEPLAVPKDTVAEFFAVWDNSAKNPSNPDPTVWCRWGKRTVDEMFGAAIFYTPQQRLATPLRIERGRQSEPAA
jgi:hypothetical protein